MQNYYPVPFVIEKTGRGERQYDIYSRLLEDRIIFIGTTIDDDVANAVIAELLFLDKSGRNQDVKMYINSPGGSVTAGLAIYDTMKLIEPEIQTFCVGQAASMGASLLAGGTKGKRFALPSARIMIHEIGFGLSGKYAENRDEFDESTRLFDVLKQHLASDSGQTFEKISKAIEYRNVWMSPSEALDFGLVDHIVGDEKSSAEDSKD